MNQRGNEKNLRKYLVLRKNENVTKEDLLEAAKRVFQGSFIVLTIKQQGRPATSVPTLKN